MPSQALYGPQHDSQQQQRDLQQQRQHSWEQQQHGQGDKLPLVEGWPEEEEWPEVNKPCSAPLPLLPASPSLAPATTPAAMQWHELSASPHYDVATCQQVGTSVAAIRL